MDTSQASEAFSALSHPGRIDIFRLLVKAGPEGLAAGLIADRIGQRQNTASVNLSVLHRAGLVSSAREGRQVLYKANFASIGAIISFLLEDCCQGNSEACGPLAAYLAQSAPTHSA